MRLSDLGGNFVFSVPLDTITLSADPVKPVWIQVAVAGEWYNVRHGNVPITRDDLARMLTNFKQQLWPQPSVELPVDYEHLSIKPDRKPGDGVAAGWFKDLELRNDGNELWGLVNWTDSARDKISKKEYRYFSPVFTPSWKIHGDKEIGTTLIGGAVTNYPTLPGCALTCSLEPELATRQQPRRYEGHIMKLKDANGNEVEIPDASLAALSLDALAGVNPHVKALNEKVPGADMKVIKVVDFDAIVSERDRLKTSAGADLTALNDTIKTLSTTVDTLKADNAKLKKDAETAAAKAIEVELDALIAAGKVLPRQKPMLIKLSTIDRAEYDKEIAAAREADPIVHTNTQHGSDGEASTSGPAVRQFDTLVDQIKNKNPKMSYADAIKQAAAENPALAKRRNLELALPVGRGGVAMTQQ